MRISPTTFGRALATICLPAGIAACGSSSSATSGSSSTVAKAVFITRGNAVCTAADTAAQAVTAPALTGSVDQPSAADLPLISAYFGKIVPIGQTLITGLKNLGEPDKDASLWHQALAEQDVLLKDIQGTATAASAGNSTAYGTAVTKTNSDTTSSNKLMDQFGMSVCGSNSSSTPAPTEAAPSAPASTNGAPVSTPAASTAATESASPG